MLSERQISFLFSGLSAAVAGLCLAAGPARAELQLCNFTESRVGVSVGYKNDNAWVTEGWWNVMARGCVVLVPGTLSGRYYYVHGIDYDRGGSWSGKVKMCVDDKSFTIKGVKDCASRGHKELGFYEVDTGEANDYTIRLTDPVKEGAGSP